MAAGAVARSSGFELETDGEEELGAGFFVSSSRVVDIATGRAGTAAMSCDCLDFSSDGDGDDKAFAFVATKGKAEAKPPCSPNVTGRPGMSGGSATSRLGAPPAEIHLYGVTRESLYDHVATFGRCKNLSLVVIAQDHPGYITWAKAAQPKVGAALAHLLALRRQLRPNGRQVLGVGP